MDKFSFGQKIQIVGLIIGCLLVVALLALYFLNPPDEVYSAFFAVAPWASVAVLGCVHIGWIIHKQSKK